MRRIRRFAALLMAVCIIASSVPVISAAQIENAGNDMDGASLRTSVEASGTGSVGRMLADAISEEQAALQASESLGYAITNLTVTGSQIDVSCRSDKTACVMVALYEESGELASFGSADVKAGEQTVTVGVSGDIPEFFTASAFMIDPETRTPLCEKYITTLYTKAMRELSDASIDDYDATLVLNLDDDSDNNFAVFDESVHIIPYQNSVNQIMDNGNGTYIVTAANADFASLRRGDVLAASTNDGDTLIVRVGQISVNGSTVLITQADEELKLTDVFQVVKIEGGCLLDENGEIPEEARIASLMDTGVETKFLDKKPFQWEKEFKGGPGGMDVTVGLEGTVSATAKVKLYFMSEEQYFEAKVSFSSEFKASISGSSDRLTIPLLPEIVSFSPVPGLYISLNPSIVLEASVEIEFSAKATASVGFAYLGGANFENRSESPKIENVSLKAEGKLYIGFSLEPKIKIAGKVHLLKWELEIAEASIIAEFGVTFSVSMEHDFLNKEHICLQCLKGTAKFSLELSAQAKLAKYFSPKVQLYKGDLETFNCYYSVDYDEFGFGECPHKQYLVTVLVKLPSGNPGASLTVKAAGQSALSATVSKEEITDAQGKAEIYLPNGAYTLTCETADNRAKGEATITVDGDKADTVIQLNVNACTVTFNVNGGTVTPNSVSIANGQTLSSLPTATRDGYTFAGWNTAVDGSGDAFTVNTPVNGNITVYAQWKAIGITWSFDETTGTLTISGNGPMENYSYLGGDKTNTPWYQYRDSIRTVKIADGVTSIGNYAFFRYYVNNPIISIKIPDSVTAIGDSAFFYCNNLSSVDIPNSVTSIGNSAFGYCYSLASVNIPDSVTSIGHSAFSHCKSLASVTIPNSVTSISAYAFYHCDSLTNVIIPNSVTSIGETAFWFYTSLTSVTIPDGVTTIGNSAFNSCTSLTSVTIPNSVTSIGPQAFDWCAKLVSIYYKGTKEQWALIKKGTNWSPTKSNHQPTKYTVYFQQ